MGVRFIDFIPYNSFIPVIQYYFYKSGNKSIKAEHIKYLEDWFWTATFSQRFSSSSLTLMKEDANWIANLVDGKNEANVFGVSLTVRELIKVRMQNKSVIKNGVLCLMALENPKDFDNGQIVTLDRTNVSRSNSKENHHFFPYSLHSKFNVDSTNINCLLNFVLISGRLNREISNKLPSVYLAGYSSSNIDIESHLKSHFINDEALKAAKNDDYHSFIQKRGESIMEMIKSKIDVDKFIEPEEDVIEESIEFDEVEELEGA